MDFISGYYQILGVPADCTAEELKRAYREKAKTLHPDRNRNPDAHHQFVLLNEAYQYLYNFKNGKAGKGRAAAWNDKWQQQEKEMARARARAYARMKYDEFVNSEHYRSLSSLTTVTDYVVSLFTIALIIFIPVIITYNYGPQGFVISILLVLFTMPLTAHAIRTSKKIHLSEFFRSLSHIIRTRAFRVLLCSVINVLILLRVGLQTLVTVNLLFSTILLCSLLSFALLRWMYSAKSKFRHYFFSCCLIPMAFNMLLLINFVFATAPRTETYHYEMDAETGSTIILLEGNMYVEYDGIRMFAGYETLRNNNTITYTLKNGLLGLPVVTAYELRSQPPD